MFGDLFFLPVESRLALRQLLFAFEERGLLGDHGGRLYAQGLTAIACVHAHLPQSGTVPHLTIGYKVWGD